MQEVNPQDTAKPEETSEEQTADLSFEVQSLEVVKGRDTVAQEQGRLSVRSDTHNW